MIGVFVMVPFLLGIPPLLGWFIGSWIDAKFGTGPWMMFLWIALGFAAGFREVIRVIKEFGSKT